MQHGDHTTIRFGHQTILVGEGDALPGIAPTAGFEQGVAVRASLAPDVLGQAAGGEQEQHGNVAAVLGAGGTDGEGLGRFLGQRFDPGGTGQGRVPCLMDMGSSSQCLPIELNKSNT